MTPHEKAQALLRIVGEIYDEGKQIIGDQWTVLDKMAAYAKQDDVEGMVRYFNNCKRSKRGQETYKKLTRAGKKSLESEEARFMRIAHDSQ